MELHLKHRPKRLSDVFGQPVAVAKLKAYLAKGTLPRALLFIGPTGCGKTSTARTLRKDLGCSVEDFTEIDCAVVDAMDTVRAIRREAFLSPMFGKHRIYLLDEIQALSRAPFAQQGLLRILEEPPKHVYFMLATTDPKKIIPTIRGRCTHIVMKALTTKDLVTLVHKIAEKESRKVTNAVSTKIATMAMGSAREALVMLEAVLLQKDEKDQLEALESPELERQSIHLCRILMKRNARWIDVAPILKEIEGEEPERVRYSVLNYARQALVNRNTIDSLAMAVMQSFRDNFYDSGHAGIAVACAEIIGNKK